jgi:hypothetical protein
MSLRIISVSMRKKIRNSRTVSASLTSSIMVYRVLKVLKRRQLGQREESKGQSDVLQLLAANISLLLSLSLALLTHKPLG